MVLQTRQKESEAVPGDMRVQSNVRVNISTDRSQYQTWAKTHTWHGGAGLVGGTWTWRMVDAVNAGEGEPLTMTFHT